MLTAVAMIYIGWLDIKSEASVELRYTNNIVTSSMQQVLHKNEALLEILGERLIELESELETVRAQNLVNNLLRGNPDLAGIGLADTDGQLVLTSFNIDRDKLPNLMNTPETTATFKQALNADHMVIGRTYYMPALRDWVIPLRYRIMDEWGKVSAVMTTGIKLESSDSLWSGNNLPEHVKLTIVRSDYYRQYSLHQDQMDYEHWYGARIAQERVDRFFYLLFEQTGFDADSFRSSGKVVLLALKSASGVNALSAVSYDPVYGNYTFTSTPLSVLYARMLMPVTWLLLLLFIFNITLYFIFRVNERLLEESKSKLEFQAKHDELTQLPNRRYLLDEFDGWQRSQEGSFSVLFIDLDDFKISNDLHGHSVGDRILQEVAKRIHVVFPDCMNIRQGGDEFIILCHETDETELMVRCKVFLEKLHEPILLDELDFSIRASIGIACAPTDGGDIDELLRKADMAMYRAKNQKSGIYLYSKDLEMRTQRIERIENALIHALQNNEFHLEYQPQVDASSKSIIGVEALLRWNNTAMGHVPPDEFICIAESTGLIQDIGKFVFETAVREMQEIQEMFFMRHNAHPLALGKLRLSINVSVQQLINDDFADFVCSVLGKYNETDIPVMIEVTESVFIHELDKTRLILEKINQAGVGISLDDFGTGYSSLSILNKLPIDELKIDKDFVRDILSDTQDWLLIKSIISLSKNLSIPVLAEGVENAEQATILTENGCDLLQGYYYSKPLNKYSLLAFLSEPEVFSSQL